MLDRSRHVCQGGQDGFVRGACYINKDRLLLEHEMNLRDAREMIKDEHVKEAARLVGKKGIDWLFERTGRQTPRFRYVVVENQRYPTKAFSFLVAQLASGSDSKTNDMTVNEAVAPLKRLGYIEVDGPGGKLTPEQEDARKTSYYLSLSRPGQTAFRRILLDAYKQRCAATGCSALDALEAAHVEPFKAGGIDTLSNGILLRADLHRLFDAAQIAVNPSTLTLHLSAEIKADYPTINGVRVYIPEGGPSPDQFSARWEAFSC